MSEQDSKLNTLFQAAVAIESSEERAAFIEEQCGDDESLRAELEKRLTTHERSSNSPETPPRELEATQAVENEGRREDALRDSPAQLLDSSDHSVLQDMEETLDIPRVRLRHADSGHFNSLDSPELGAGSSGGSTGRYRVEGEIARGGMGAILKGRDTDLGRDLAIKVLLDEHKDRPDVIQRFIEEAQIGGQLQHPGIAPVYELGQFADQRPFFSMKLVKGQTLSKLLSDRSDPSDDRARFVSVFEQICQTLSYAHARGVIHRDLKPSNVMVGAFGEVQVMDWGLAKVLVRDSENERNTTANQKQDVSVIETRRSVGNDLTSSTGKGSSDTQMGSVLGTPAYMPPEQALGEIDQLDQRADVFGLGAILCEILTGKPPYVAVDRLAVFRLASRGRLDDALSRLDRCGADAELIALAKQCLAPEPEDRPDTAGALAERVAGYLQSVETKLREAELERATQAARVVEQQKRFRVTLTLAATVLVVLLCGIAGTAWQAQKAEMARVAEGERAAEAQRLRKVAEESATKEQAARAEAQMSLTQTQKAFEILDSVFDLDSKKIARQEKPLQELLADQMDTAANQLKGRTIGDPLLVAKLQNTLGSSLSNFGRPERAIAVLQECVTTRRAELGPDNVQTLLSIVNLAGAYIDAGRHTEAQQLLEETLPRLKAQLDPNHPDTLISTINLAAALIDAGNPKDAIELLEDVLPPLKEQRGEDDPQVLVGMINLASAYRLVGQYDLAVELHEQIRNLTESKMGPDHPDTLTNMSTLATSYTSAGRSNEAIELAKETLERCKNKLGIDRPETIGSMMSLGAAYKAAGKYAEAVATLEEASRRANENIGTEHPQTLIIMRTLGEAYTSAGRDEDAIKTHKEALRRCRAKYDNDHPHTLRTMISLATVLNYSGRYDEALELLDEALPVLKGRGSGHPDTIAAINVLAMVYPNVGKAGEALKLLEEALPQVKAALGPDHPSTLSIAHNLAVTYWRQDQFDKSIQLLEETLPLKRSRLGDDHPDTFSGMRYLGVAYRETKRYDDAVKLLQDVLDHYKVTRGLDNRETTIVMHDLAVTYRQAGRHEQFMAAIKELFPYAKSSLGPGHDATLYCASNLANGYNKIGDTEEALKWKEEELRLRRQEHGIDAAPTRQCMNHLAVLYSTANEPDKSIELLEELVEWTKGENGRADPQSLLFVANLGVSYQRAGRSKEAIPLLENVFASATEDESSRWVLNFLIQAYQHEGLVAKRHGALLIEIRKWHPPESLAITNRLGSMTMLLIAEKAYAEAEPLARECVANFDKHVPDSWLAYSARLLVAQAVLGQKKYEEAEPLLLKAYEGMKAREDKIPPEGQSHLNNAIERLIELYEATNKMQDADKWRIELEKRAGKPKSPSSPSANSEEPKPKPDTPNPESPKPESPKPESESDKM